MMDDIDEQHMEVMRWIDRTGIEVVHQTDTREGLEASWEKWTQMSEQDRRTSDEKSIELYGMDNSTHYGILCLLYN